MPKIKYILKDKEATSLIHRFSSERGLLKYFNDNFLASLDQENGVLNMFDTAEDCILFVENYASDYLSLRVVNNE